MTTIVTVVERIFYFIVVLGILVFIHELGHFLAAKFFRVRVVTFSLGFGKKLAAFTRGDTEYRIAMIPLGGYVKMAGEVFDEELSKEPDHFTAKPRWQRVIVYLAGPGMNIGLAVFLWWALFVSGVPVADIPEGPPVIESIAEGSAAERAGLEPGDVIVAIGERTLASLEDYGQAVALPAARRLSYTIERGEERLQKDVELDIDGISGLGRDGIRVRTPIIVGSVVPGSPAEAAGLLAGDRVITVDGHYPGGPENFVRIVSSSAGETLRLSMVRGEAEVAAEVVPVAGEDGVPRIGIVFGQATRVVEGPVEALRESLSMAQDNVTMLFDVLSRLVRLAISPKVLSGPLEIARVSQEVASQGFVPFVWLLAFISMQLGLFNLLPIPVIDGGQIVILLSEMVARRDIPMRIRERVLQFGFVFIILFAVSVLALDVYKQVMLTARGQTIESSTPAAREEEPREPVQP